MTDSYVQVVADMERDSTRPLTPREQYRMQVRELDLAMELLEEMVVLNADFQGILKAWRRILRRQAADPVVFPIVLSIALHVVAWHTWCQHTPKSVQAVMRRHTEDLGGYIHATVNPREWRDLLRAQDRIFDLRGRRTFDYHHPGMKYEEDMEDQ